jgi:pimeloyl-ACP methyl ester carboxylesterase
VDPVLILRGSDPTVGTPSIERPIFLSSEAKLFGIVTEPRPTDNSGRGIILLNQGANHHIGGSRMHVSFARDWAEQGYVVLRLDLAGIGDSATAPGNSDSNVFPSKALDDVQCAIEFLRDRYKVNHVTLGGLCSGGYHALRAASAGVPVDRIFLVNPVNFFWKEGMNLHEVQLSQVVRDPGAYYERIFSYRALKKLFTGEVDVWRIIRVYINSLIPLESTLRDLLRRRLRIRLRHDLGLELEEIVGRGVRVVFIFSRGDPGLDLLKLQAGPSFGRLGAGCKMHIIEGGDHTFSQSAPRLALKNILADELQISR